MRAHSDHVTLKIISLNWYKMCQTCCILYFFWYFITGTQKSHFFSSKQHIIITPQTSYLLTGPLVWSKTEYLGTDKIWLLAENDQNVIYIDYNAINCLKFSSKPSSSKSLSKEIPTSSSRNVYTFFSFILYSHFSRNVCG